MDYIFTELFFDFLKTYIDIIFIIEMIFSNFFIVISILIPSFIKAVIGYCHFYYQLGYGLIFYIYIYRRYRSKKNKNWSTFYGNSVINWISFNLSIFNTTILNRAFLIFIVSEIKKVFIFLYFWFCLYTNNSKDFQKMKNIFLFLIKKTIVPTWTPLFKRSSYIAFVTVLKRFIKRK